MPMDDLLHSDNTDSDACAVHHKRRDLGTDGPDCPIPPADVESGQRIYHGFAWIASVCAGLLHLVMCGSYSPDWHTKRMDWPI